VIDHITALKHGAKDVPANMQWQRREDALWKDRVEEGIDLSSLLSKLAEDPISRR
jgi:hypothetical protein